MSKVELSVELAGVKLKNPIVVASGTFGFGREYGQFYDLSELGGICAKGLTLHRWEGNPPPRIAETPMGILNSVGLQNPGVDAFIAEELPELRKHDLAVIANISGNTRDFSGVNTYAAFWTSEDAGDKGVLRYIYEEKDIVYRFEADKKGLAASVRCVRDAE